MFVMSCNYGNLSDSNLNISHTGDIARSSVRSQEQCGNPDRSNHSESEQHRINWSLDDWVVQ